ncbi:MAG TPA: hypothetical protein VFE10_12335 [Phenylobacterium sp.]|jgi:hypothetical protein|nr:hypothetical protein [Phenylobacterium sp.]
MSMRTMLLAVATAATLLVPAVAGAQDYSRHRDAAPRYDARRWHDEDRGYRAYGYAPVYDYGYSYPAYGYDAYQYAAPAGRDRGDREHDRRDRRDGDRR